MADPKSPRAWTYDRGRWSERGGAAAANRRIAASSVAPIFRPNMNAPCVLALLGSQPPRTSRDLPINRLHGNVEPPRSARLEELVRVDVADLAEHVRRRVVLGR